MCMLETLKDTFLSQHVRQTTYLKFDGKINNILACVIIESVDRIGKIENFIIFFTFSRE